MLLIYIPIILYISYHIILIYLDKFVYKKSKREEEVEEINSKIIIVTGCNSGMGLETAFEMADRGATVILACLTTQFTEDAERQIREKTQNGILIKKQIDLGSSESIKKFCKDISKQFDRIDIIVNNAGVFTLEKKQKSKDNYEIHWAVNYLGPFLITNLLISLLRNSQDGRVVNIGSSAFLTGVIDFSDLMKDNVDINESSSISDWTVFYSNSKLALAHFTREMSKRENKAGSNVKSYFLCPGYVNTPIINFKSGSLFMTFFINIFKLFTKTPNQGCQTAIYCSISKKAEYETGKYYRECGEWNPNKFYFIIDLMIRDKIPLLDEKVSKKLWEISEFMVGLK